MPVGLSPAAAPTIKSKPVAISTGYPKLSTLIFPAVNFSGKSRRARLSSLTIGGLIRLLGYS
jgi:hypothetical protein